MSTYKGADVERALLRKGFVRDNKGSHHTYFRFRPDGLPTSVSTYTSRGGGDVDAYLQKKMAKQIGLIGRELEEFRISSAEKDFDKSRAYFRDHLLHIYQEFMAMTPGNASGDAIEMKQRLEELFSVEEFVA